MLATTDFYLQAIKVNSKAINYMPIELLTPEFYSQAIQANPEVFVSAIQSNAKNLFKFPKGTLTPDFYIQAIQANPNVFKLIDPDVLTKEMCLEAIKHRAYQLKYVPEHILKSKEVEFN
jgi:hypothetical protein